MPGVEFLSEGRDGEPDEDVLDQGPRHALPRWVIALVLALLVAGAVTAIAAHRSTPQAATHPAATSPAASPTTGVSQPAPAFDQAVPNDGTGPALKLGSSAPVLDAAMNPDGRWVLQADRLTRDPARGPSRHIELNLHVPVGASAHLVAAADAALLWVIIEGGRQGEVLEYDASTLALLLDESSPTPFLGAAALHDRLFLSSAGRLLELRGQGLSRVIALGAGLGQLAADPAAGRLLVVSIGLPTRIWTYVPGSRTPRLGPLLPLGKATLAVVRGAIWVGGYTDGRQKLVRLDSRTLRIKAVSPLARQVGPGAIVVAAGDRVFWARDGGASASLWCVDARTGRTLQRWQDIGNVSSSRGGALLGSDAGAFPLRLTGCPG